MVRIFTTEIKTVAILLCGFAFFGGNSCFSQQRSLYIESFNSGFFSMGLNGFVFGADNIGPNQWVINDDFTGEPPYPNTPTQDQTDGSAIIAGSPRSRYLHISDANRTRNLNASYNPAFKSERFAIINQRICTHAMRDITLSIAWMGVGSETAYGEVWYALDDGEWKVATSTEGRTKLHKQPVWKTERYSLPVFANQSGLRFAFRWVNESQAGEPGIALGIDDIFVIGSIDPTYRVNIRTNLRPLPENPMCQGTKFYIDYEHDKYLCAGTYRFELSGPDGNFNAPMTIDPPMIEDGVVLPNRRSLVEVQVPGTTFPGECYKIRAVRVEASPPQVIGTGTACFGVKRCPNRVEAHATPAVLTEDSACVMSAIDVPFKSFGIFLPNNTYFAELSDSVGNFDKKVYRIGQLASGNTFNESPFGSIAGLIPFVPTSCMYRLRIRSTNPPAVHILNDTFCIRRCNVEFNNTRDISFCLTAKTGQTVKVSYLLHQRERDPDRRRRYAFPNEFRVQYLATRDLKLLAQGGQLGAKVDSVNGTMDISLPPLPELEMLGLGVGTYYARLLATRVTPGGYDTLSTIIRVTISELEPDKPLLALISEPVTCLDAGDVTICIDNYPVGGWPPKRSSYEWYINDQRITLSEEECLVFTAPAPGVFTVKVREWKNPTCFSAMSNSVSYSVLSRPTVTIAGDRNNVCVGQPTNFCISSPQPSTFYTMEVDSARYIKKGPICNTVVFDKPGRYKIRTTSINKCGSDNASFDVTVTRLPNWELEDSLVVCSGESATIRPKFQGAGFFEWRIVGQRQIFSRDSVLSFATDTITRLAVKYTMRGNRCPINDTIKIIPFKMAASAGNDITICFDQKIRLNASGGTSYRWRLDSSFVNPADTLVPNPLINPIRSKYFYVKISNRQGCTVLDSVFVTAARPQPQARAYQLCRNTPVRIQTPYSGAVLKWEHNGDTTDFIVVDKVGEYRLHVKNRDGSCAFIDTFKVTDLSSKVDTIRLATCTPEASVILKSRFANGSYFWADGTSGRERRVFGEGIYWVQFINQGCIVRDTFIVKYGKGCDFEFKAANVIITNPTLAASPDNTQWKYETKGVIASELQIFNRWGEKVWEASFNGENGSWDGSLLGKSEKAFEGVYVYYVRVKTNRGVYYNQAGTITVLR